MTQPTIGGQTAVQIVLKPPVVLTSWPCGPAGCLALLLIKAGDAETNPGPTTTHKQVWICHKQIHGRKQISLRCNMIKHWVFVGVCHGQVRRQVS